MHRAEILSNHNRRHIISPHIKVTIVCFLSIAFTMGAITNCSGIYGKLMSESLCYSRAELSVIYSLYSVGQIMTALLAGHIFGAFRVTRVIQFCALLTGIGMGEYMTGYKIFLFCQVQP